MKDTQDMPRATLLDAASLPSMFPGLGPPQSLPPRRISRNAIIACIEEALRIIDEDLEGDIWETNSSHSSASQERDHPSGSQSQQ